MALVAAAGVMSSCSTSPTKSATGSELPSRTSVVGGRFVTRVELDNGDLVVTPAATVRPQVSLNTAQALFSAADAVNGAYRFSVLGLGEATVSPEVAAATTTTGPGSAPTTTTPVVGAGTGTTTTPAGSGAAAATTTTTGANAGTTTTTAGTSASSSTTLATTPATAPLPRYDRRVAWVGIAWGADCPAGVGRPEPATRYVVVVIDADTGGSVIAYTSRSSATCGGPVLAPSVTRPNELVSVPWQPVGPTSTAVRVTMPACSTYFGWTQVPGPGAPSVQVVVQKPFDPTCGSTGTTVQVVDDVVPLGTAQANVPHAALGPVGGLRTLAGG
jgi:hypothetical protein